MVLERKIETKEKADDYPVDKYPLDKDFLPGWYKSSERSQHPHPKKLKVECSLDEDIIQWLENKTSEDEEYPMYINYYLRKIMDRGLDKNF